MSPTKVSLPALYGNPEPTAPVVVHQYAAPIQYETAAAFAERIKCTREAFQKAMDAKGVPYATIGKHRVYAVADVLAVIRGGVTIAAAPVVKAPKAAKATPKTGASTEEMLAANGFRLVKEAGK
jgi:hypothetical protein